ncbi:NAD(P)H-hydrate dehydratase [Candidatus Micrarchaeota archaeon]|nr:NAD(P)H-hydrate dehydratase [Candidatus Micrarchaeota archaeon]
MILIKNLVLRLPKKNSRKGDNGVLTVVGGSKKYHGAPLLAINAASRLVDLVYYYSPEKLNEKVMASMKASALCSIFVQRKDLFACVKKSDCVLIGNGLALSESNKKLVNYLLKAFPEKKFVLDAGALRLVDLNNLNPNVLVTPHSAEFNALFKTKASPEQVLFQAKKHGCLVLLKQGNCFVSDGKKIYYNKNGNAGMTKGGTGDVLAGLCAALACKNSLLASAKAAAWLNGEAGDYLFKKQGFAFNALDLSNALPIVFSKNV